MASKRRITVTGTGVVYGQPDIARVSLGVEHAHDDLGEAFSATSAAMEAVMNALIQLGIDQRDLKTTGLGVYQRSKPQAKGDKTPPVQEYVVSNTVLVTARDVNLISDVLKQGIEQGANSVRSVSFDIADPVSLENQARAMAMTDALDRARQMAAALQSEVGKPLKIVELDPSSPHITFMAAGAAPKQSFARMPVSEGEQSVSISVQVVFQLK